MSDNGELVGIVGPEDFENLIFHFELPFKLLPHGVKNGNFIAIQEEKGTAFPVELGMFLLLQGELRHINKEYLFIPKVLFKLT